MSRVGGGGRKKEWKKGEKKLALLVALPQTGSLGTRPQHCHRAEHRVPSRLAALE